MGGGRARLGRSFAVIIALVVIGTASAVYVLANQGTGWQPFADTYKVKAEFRHANGIESLGQPVNVAGVKVGSVIAADLGGDGNAVVTLRIQRDALPRVYSNASALIAPITPLGDLSIALDPGRAPGRPVQEGSTIGTAATADPVPLESLLSALDGDTRRFMSSLIVSLQQGTHGRETDLRRALATLGPTTAQVGHLSKKLARRRVALAGLVHNLAVVTRAATRDRQLGQVVEAGNATLESVASEDTSLRRALDRMPRTLATTRRTLDTAATFSRELGPTLRALQPAVRRLPATLDAIPGFANLATAVIRGEVRPLVSAAQPLGLDLGRATPKLNALAPNAVRDLQALNYLFNDLARNPPGDDEGGLFWFSWFVHNWQSVLSVDDAHGTIGRATVLANCRPSPPSSTPRSTHCSGPPPDFRGCARPSHGDTRADIPPHDRPARLRVRLHAAHARGVGALQRLPPAGPERVQLRDADRGRVDHLPRIGHPHRRRQDRPGHQDRAEGRHPGHDDGAGHQVAPLQPGRWRSRFDIVLPVQPMADPQPKRASRSP